MASGFLTSYYNALAKLEMIIGQLLSIPMLLIILIRFSILLIRCDAIDNAPYYFNLLAQLLIVAKPIFNSLD
jgi:hypothetical protein